MHYLIIVMQKDLVLEVSIPEMNPMPQNIKSNCNIKTNGSYCATSSFEQS